MTIDNRNTLNIIFTLTSLIFIVYSVNNVSLFQAHHKQIAVEAQTLSAESRNETQSFPVRLIIAKLNIDAPIEYLGITPEGEMAVPEGSGNVGWYKFGTSPGFPGSAVISGHLDGSGGKPGIFSSLGKLEPGDKIDVLNDQGVTNTFIVRESRIYEPGYAEEVFLIGDSGAHLNLVTCDGVWEENKKSYSKRLVVFTDLVD